MMFDVDVKSVLITGTTSGVGRALLDHYAQDGVKVISVDRRRVLGGTERGVVDVGSHIGVDAVTHLVHVSRKWRFSALGSQGGGTCERSKSFSDGSPASR